MSDRSPAGDVAASIVEPAVEFCALADKSLGDGKPDAVPDKTLQDVFAAAVKLYAAKSEDRAEALAPFGKHDVNATEAVVAICAIMRAADLNFFDLQMWYRRGDHG